MTTYNTGNPIGSTDARDLYDNAQNLDNFANGAAASYTDRLGVSRRSMAGIDAAADNVLNSIGYAVPVAYTSGISLTLTSQTVEYNGVVYAPKSSALPFTTSSWGTDEAKFRAIQVTDADLITYTQSGTGAVAATVQSKLREWVSVFDFMTEEQIADAKAGTELFDVTDAFVKAQQASKYVRVPPGKYKVTGLRIYDHVNLIGSGYENTAFVQGDPDQPAINCTSDATVGQLLSLRLENFWVVGHPSATVSAVKIEALGAYAIYRSHFDMIISSCYQGLNMQANTANNVFYCTFRMDVVSTQTTAVVLNGGTYNTYDFFIAQVGNGRMVEHSGFNNTFIRLVGEGQVYCTGQSTIFFSPTIEELPNAPPSEYGFYLQGFNQTLINPTVILNAANSTKITYCVRPFASSLIVNPRFIVNGTLHPFAPSNNTWTLQGPGSNECANKMEVIYNGTDTDKDLRNVDILGDVRAFITPASGTYSGKYVQYQAYDSGAFVNHQIFNHTDAMIYNLAGPATLINVSLGYPSAVRRNGQTLSVYTSNSVASMTWNGNGSDTSLFPASMSAGQVIRMVYDSGTNKWWPA